MFKKVFDIRQLSPSTEEDVAALAKEHAESNPNQGVFGEPPPEQAKEETPVEQSKEDATPEQSKEDAPPKEHNPALLDGIIAPSIKDKGNTQPKEEIPVEQSKEDAPIFNPSDYGFNEESGIKSIDDVRLYIEKGKQLDQVTTDLEGYKTKNTELEGQINSQFNPFATDELAEFNGFVKETGINNFKFFNEIRNADINNMDPIDKLVLEQQAIDLNGNLSREQIKSVIESNYRLTPKKYDYIQDDDERERLVNENKEDIKISLAKATMDANAATQKILDLKGKIKKVDLRAIAETQKVEYEQKIEQLSKDWQPHVDRLSNENKKLIIKGTNEKGESISFVDFDIPEVDMQDMRNRAMELIHSQGRAADSDSIVRLSQVMKDMAHLKYRDQIYTKIHNNAIATQGKKLEQDYNNPSGDKIATPEISIQSNKPMTAKERMERDQQRALDIVDSGNY